MREFPGIFLGLICKNQFPIHQSSSFEHFDNSSSKPSLIDSLIPGIDNKKRVSEIALQSSSETKTALDLFPVIIIGLCEEAVSSIRLYNFERASVAFNIVMARELDIVAAAINKSQKEVVETALDFYFDYTDGIVADNITEKIKNGEMVVHDSDEVYDKLGIDL